MSHYYSDNDGNGPPLTMSAFDPNELRDRTCAKRQLSYLQAVGGVVSQPSATFDATRDMATHSSHARHPPQYEVGTSRQQYVPMQVSLSASNMGYSSHVPLFGQPAVACDSVPFMKNTDSRNQQCVDDFANERLPCAADSRGKTYAHIQNLNTNCNPNGPDFTKAKSDFQPWNHHRLSEMASAQKVKQIPRAVIAPMSQTQAMDRPSPIDSFSSLARVQKMTNTGIRNPQKDFLNLEVSTKNSYGAIIPATDKVAGSSFTNSACSVAYQQSLGSGHGDSVVYSNPLSASDHSGMVGEYFESLHPSQCSTWSSDVEKSKTFDDVDYGLSYIHPQTVESVLSYQNLARKSLGGRNQKDVLPGAITGKSLALSNASRNLAYMGTTSSGWPSNEFLSKPFSSEMSPEGECRGDRRSASSTSTACSSQVDSGYSGERCNSVGLTRIRRSPELPNLASYPYNGCPAPDISAGHSSGDVSGQAVNWEADVGSSMGNDTRNHASQSYYSQAGQVRTVQFANSWLQQQQQNHAEVLQSRLMSNEAHLAMHKEAPLARRPHMQLNSNIDATSSRSDSRNNHHLNTMPMNDRKLYAPEVNASREPAMVNDCAPKPGLENTIEQTKYLSMLQKQIKLYRMKDKATRRMENASEQRITMHNTLLNTDRTIVPDRNIIQSSCFHLEKVSQDSEFKSTVAKLSSAKEICGSMDLNKCELNPLEMGGNVQDLISKKKALERKRINLEMVESNRDNQGASFIRPDSGVYRDSTGLNDLQKRQMHELKTKAEPSPGCCGKVIVERGTNTQQLAYSKKCNADADFSSCVPVNSGEDIVNTWALVKNERNLQLRKDDSTLVTVTSPNYEDRKYSSTPYAEADANHFQVSSVHVAPTFDDIGEGSKFGKQVKKSVSFSDSVALIASTEEVPNKAVDYVEYVTSFLRKRTNDLKSVEAPDDRSSQTGSSSRGSLLSGSRSNSNVSVPESSGSSCDRDSDFYENDGSLCSEEDSEGTTVDETGRIRCSLCHKRWIDTSEMYCKDCCFYMSKFQQAA